jgi:hypothetical protein
MILALGAMVVLDMNHWMRWCGKGGGVVKEEAQGGGLSMMGRRQSIAEEAGPSIMESPTSQGLPRYNS